MEKKNNSFHLARISLMIFYYGEISDIFPGYIISFTQSWVKK